MPTFRYIYSPKYINKYLLKLTLRFTMMIGLFSLPAISIASPPWLKPYEEKCEAGHIQDCFNVAVAYKKGGLDKNKVDADKALSEKYIKKGVLIGKEKCNRGSKYECYKLGILYFEGFLVPANFPLGLDYMQKSCRGGYQQACDWMLNSGIPVQ